MKALIQVVKSKYKSNPQEYRKTYYKEHKAEINERRRSKRESCKYVQNKADDEKEYQENILKKYTIAEPSELTGNIDLCCSYFGCRTILLNIEKLCGNTCWFHMDVRSKD